MLSLTRLLTTPLLAGLLLLGHPGAQAETASLQLDNNGNITQRSTSRGTTTYTYDALNRLDTESGPAKTQTFKYDADGNRLSDGSGSYTYSPTANRMATRLGATVTLDPAGHITADGTGRTYTYNQAGQLTTSSKGSLLASYYYNAQGQRTRKVTTANAPQGAQTTVYHYDLQGHLIAETSGTGTPIRTYVWRDDTPIAQIEHQPSRKIFYYEV
ncbi:YD repeat-containing protein, partial [Sulfurirhabdus autotrophica]